MAGWEWVALVVEKESFFACGKKLLLSAVRKVFCKRKRFCFAEKAFLIHARATDIKKSLFSAHQNFNFPPHPN